MNCSLYLNCAASSFPKPEAVLQCAKRAMYLPPEDAGRSNGFSLNGEDCRLLIASLIGCLPQEIFFTSGATESANLIIRGLQLRGSRVIATATEHNCILRPLYNHPDQPEVSIAPCDENGAVRLPDLEALIRPDTKYLFLNHCSNVTGYVQDLHAIGELCHLHGITLIVDASQSIGCTEIDVARDHVGILIFTGHKNLFGLAGSGGYYVNKSVQLPIVKTGGTGIDSLWLKLPADYTNREPGTANTVGLASLAAGTGFVLEYGAENIRRELAAKRKRLVDGLTGIFGIRVLHPFPLQDAGPVVSFVADGLSPSDVGYILSESYGITLRTGFHCCPLIHEQLKTPQGTIRASFSVLTEDSALDALCSAIQEIQKGGAAHED